MKTCIACGGKKRAFFLKARDRLDPHAEYVYGRCTQCDLVTLEERTNNKNFQAYNLSANLSLPQKAVLTLFHRRLRKFKKSGRVLDFGAGAGNLAKYLSRKGYDLSCFEVDENSATWLKNVQKLNVVDSSLGGQYDIIIMEQVLEHLPEPAAILKKLKEHLATGGILLISIPNINSLQARIFRANWFHLDAPRHLNHFYKKSFQSLLIQANLSILKRYFFNLHIDPTGWLWSMNPSKRNRALNTPWELLKLGLCLPLVIITAAFRNTGYILYIVTHGK
jgi:2-polyprenyl-3-methyl-5-hydroxy-6-metoxy-1,4-benzoquinol methylase